MGIEGLLFRLSVDTMDAGERECAARKVRRDSVKVRCRTEQSNVKEIWFSAALIGEEFFAGAIEGLPKRNCSIEQAKTSRWRDFDDLN